MELTPEIQAVRDVIIAQITDFKSAAKADIDEIRSKLATATTVEQLTGLKSQVEQLRAEVLRAGPGSEASQPQIKTFGQLFAESPQREQFNKHWLQGSTGLQFPERTFFERSNFAPALKTLITSSDVGSSTPGILIPERVPGIIKPNVRRVRVRDLIPFTTTKNNAIEYLKENAFTNAASPQTEGSAKAESALTFTIAYANVQTLAHWIPATRQILDDLAVLQSYIDTRLLDGLADTEDYELLRGDGTGVHLLGLMPQATAVVGTYADAGDTKIDKINNALAELEVAEFIADGLVVNPADWRAMQKIKDDAGGANTGMYVLGGPGSNPKPMVWDLPVVRTTAMAVGNFLVGQFTGSVQGYDRMQSQIDISNSHGTFFIENKVAIRAEERITLAVFRPGAFRRGTY